MKLKIRRPYSYETGQLAPAEKRTGRYTRYHLAHSAKGSTWEDHKYVKVVDGVYYYPDSYEGGRHLSDATKSKFGEYSKDDPDFDEANYNDKNRLGDTDFYGFTKPDGTVVVLEEDMKWTLPAGTDLKEMTKRLEAADRSLEGNNHSAEDWKKVMTEAIDGSPSSDSGSDDDDKAADDVIKGKYGNGADRKKALGDRYEAVQKKVNEKLKDKKLKHSELYHHGILGMKWGRKNGPPYPLRPGDHSAAEQKAGWKQSLAGGSPAKASTLSDKELSDFNKRKSLENQYNKLTGQDKSNTERLKDMVDSTSNSTRQLNNLMNEGGKQKPEKIRPDLSDKSDKELRDAINRENLERQYTELFGEEKKSKAKAGKEFAQKVLTGTTGALTITSLALSIAVGVKTLKGL